MTGAAKKEALKIRRDSPRRRKRERSDHAVCKKEEAAKIRHHFVERGKGEFKKKEAVKIRQV